MKSAAASIFVLLMVHSFAHGSFTNFDSLVLGTEYLSGSIFMSDGLSFEATDFNGKFSLLRGIVRVKDFESSGGTGNELSIYGGLNFMVPSDTQYVSMRYWASADRGLIINGIPTPVGTRFSDLDGTFIGGVLISVKPAPPLDRGKLVLSGPITFLVIGGSELAIDNVLVHVPEPSTAALLLVFSSISALRRI